MEELREKLVDLLHNGVRCPGTVASCDDCQYQTMETPCDEFYATADMLIANGVTVQRWIPVTERLPEPFEIVLVYEQTRNHVSDAYLTRHLEWAGVRMNVNVTHWMPMPEQPKEVER